MTGREQRAWCRLATGAASVLRRVPLTTGLVLTLAVTRLLGSPGVLGTGAGPLGDGRWWTLATSALTAAPAWTTPATVVVVVLLLGPTEHRWGTRPTVYALVCGQLAAGALGAGVVALLAALGDRWGQLLSTAVVTGPLPGVLAAATAASAAASPLTRRRLRLGLAVVLTGLVLYAGTAGDVHRLAGYLVGLTAGVVVARRRGVTRGGSRISRRESRTLVALIVAAAAVGPLVAALSRTPEGPWAVVSHLFVSGRPPPGLLREVCRTGDPEDCRVLLARAHLTGAGPALLSILPVVVQLVLAEGLRRGRRAAWVGAVLFTGVLTVLGAVVVAGVLQHPADSLGALGTARATLPTVSLWAPVVAPGAVLILLLATRTRFAVPAAPGTARRWALLAGTGLGVVVAGYLAAGTLLAGEWASPPGLGRLLLDLPARMLPPGWLGEVAPRVVPLHGLARVLAQWTGVACWAVLLGAAWAVVRPAVPRGDAARARALVDAHGDGPLSFMTTWVGNRWWFTPDGRAVVAFRVLGGVALTTGDPVGPPDARAAAAEGFSSWCQGRGWTPCWYSVGDEGAAAARRALPGAHRVQVAAETWLPLGELAFVGKRWQDVRTAINRAARDGVEARWTTWADAPLVLREELARSSEEWLAGKGLPEMGFTLGGLDELADPAVRCLLAVAPDGRVHGVTSWLPAHRDGVPVGWTLDLMRRSPGCPPGTMEFLVGTAALAFQAEGAEFLSLSGAPLALPAGEPDAALLARLLAATGRWMEPVYGFRSLLAFKAKFQPRHRPLWLVYPETTDLPRIARAVSRAYLPHLAPAQALRLVRALLAGRRSHPGSTGGRTPPTTPQLPGAAPRPGSPDLTGTPRLPGAPAAEPPVGAGAR